MKQAGPLLETLTRHLAECPTEFLAEPRIGPQGQVHVAAVVADLVRALHGEALTPLESAAFQSTNPKRDRNRLRLTLIGCWLLHAEWFRASGQRPAPAAILNFLTTDLSELAHSVKAEASITDPDRREELARLCLKAFELRPSGETEVQAQDRLATLNTTERQRVIKAAQEAEKRAQEIRDEMARQAALEAQMKEMRE